MDRPYIVCHILASLDGRISGSFMGTGACAPALAAYNRIREQYDADALVYGTATTQGFVGYAEPKLPARAEAPDGDYAAPGAHAPLYVSVDPAGAVAWESGTFKRAGRADAHVVEVLTESTPRAYRAYLRNCGVSYILAGEDRLDCALAAEKLGRLFGVRTAQVAGGGVVDWSFLRAGVVDEVSVVVAPAVEASHVATTFDESLFAPGGAAAELELKRVETLDGGAVHLVYAVR